MRQAGILLHITSLPSPGGIGTLGKTAMKFVDYLADAGAGIWQMLPVGPTGYGESPYQSTSTFAGNPLLIDIPTLVRKGLMPADQAVMLPDTDKVDFEALIPVKHRMLEAAYRHSWGKLQKKIAAFEDGHPWLHDYCVYAAIKEKFGQTSWMTWPDEYRLRKKRTLAKAEKELADRINYHKFLQYLFDCQWNDLKAYAHKKGIKLFGDMPIYVAEDSADTWANPENFQFDKDRRPILVAGVPPNYFSEDGQLWGNPLYNWRRMKKNGYAWWQARLRHMAARFDMVRIDHFIGFANYYAVPFGAPNARIGDWIIGPGKDFFRVIKAECPDVHIIAEDLGAVNRRVKSLLKFCGYPGMKVLQFGFSGDDQGNIHHPRHVPANCIAYTGTHDNDTTLGWFKSRESEAEKQACLKYIHAAGEKDVVEKMIACVLGLKADTAVIPMQDLLNLDTDARMNTPGTLGGNWLWRLTKIPGKKSRDHLRGLIIATGRYPQTDLEK